VSMIVNLDMNWIYRPQDYPGTDYGIDAHLEVTDDDGVETGRLIAAQVKTGQSYFREEVEAGFINRPADRHVRYWQEHPLPVILILVDEKTRVAFWARTENIEATEKGGWKLLVPRNQTLNKAAKPSLSEIAVGAGTERTRARHEEREQTERLRRRVEELEATVAAYLAQLTQLSAPGNSYTKPPPVDVLALTFADLITWAERVDFTRQTVASENRTAYVLAAEHLFFRESIAEHDAAKAVTLLLLAEEWAKAGATFLHSLNVLRRMPHVDSPSIVDFLAASSLPADIPLDLRIVIRSTHAAARRKHGRPADKLLAELDNLVSEATSAEGYAVTVAAFGEARASGNTVPERAIRYIRAAAVLRPHATGFGGAPFPASVDAMWPLMLELTAAGVSSEADLVAWLEALESVPAEARDAFLSDEMNVVTFANRFWLEESARTAVDRAWGRVHDMLVQIESWSVSRSAALFFAAARRARIVVRGEYEHDLRSAIQLAANVPPVIREHGHAMFLINEIAASQFLYADAHLESVVAFRGALATKPIDSSVLPTTLLKAAQAAAASNDFAQAAVWAQEGVGAARANYYKGSADVVIARAELALAIWFGGDREGALDLWDNIAEELFAIEEETPRWRGLVVRFHWAGGYLANTYRTGVAPTVDAEGQPYGEPRPGSFLINLADQANAFTERVRFGVLLVAAAVSDERGRDARARWWIYAALELATTHIPEWRVMIAFLALPHLLEDHRFSDAVRLGREMVSAWDKEQFMNGVDPAIVAISFTVIPAFLAVARCDAEVRRDAARALRNAIRDAAERDPTWEASGEIVELAFLSTREPAVRRAALTAIHSGDTAARAASPLPMLCDLAASIIPGLNIETALALHTRALAEILPRLSAYTTMHRLHVAPFFQYYWRARVSSVPCAFADQAALTAALEATADVPIVDAPRAVLLAVARSLGLA
jgi:hypothetical protein